MAQKQAPNQLNNLQTKAFKSRNKFFACGEVRYTDKEGNSRMAGDGEPIDPCDADFEAFMKTNAITDVDPKGFRAPPEDTAGDEGLSEL